MFYTRQIFPDDHAIFNVYVPGPEAEPVFSKLFNAMALAVHFFWIARWRFET